MISCLFAAVSVSCLPRIRYNLGEFAAPGPSRQQLAQGGRAAHRIRATARLSWVPRAWVAIVVESLAVFGVRSTPPSAARSPRQKPTRHQPRIGACPMGNPPGRILVTGASGQLGSHLLRELRSRDLSATAWSRRPNVELFGYRCQSVDLCEVDQVVAAFRAARPDVVIHAGAMSGVGDCFRDPTQAPRQHDRHATARRTSEPATGAFCLHIHRPGLQRPQAMVRGNGLPRAALGLRADKDRGGARRAEPPAASGAAARLAVRTLH